MAYLSPAAYVIHKIGGVRRTARIIGRSPTAVSKWRVPKAKDGRGGIIPRKNFAAILGYAALNEVDITMTDLEKGRRVRLPKKPVWEQWD